MIAYIPGVIGLASNTSWAIMWLAMPLLLLKCKIELNTINILGLIFLSYASLSLLWSPHGMLELLQLFALASVFVWAATLKNLRRIVLGLSIGLTISAIIATLQYFEVETFAFKSTAKSAGLFINSNIYAETSGMLLLLILIYKFWWFIPSALPGLMVSSRAVVLALGVSIAMMLWAEYKHKVASIVTFSGSCLIAIAMTLSNSTIIQSSEGTVNLLSVTQRSNMWQDMLSGFTLFGHGIGSFIYKFPEYNAHLDTSMFLAEYAHNDLLQLIFELGIGALPLILIVVLLLKVKDAHKYPLIFFIAVSFFGFPLHMPVTIFMVAIVAAQLSKLSVVRSDFVYNSRSIISNRLAATQHF